jgi:hypothetical protein
MKVRRYLLAAWWARLRKGLPLLTQHTLRMSGKGFTNWNTPKEIRGYPDLD